MKKMMTLMLGMALAFTSVGLTFAQDAPKKDDSKKENTKKRPSKKKEDTKKEGTR